MNPLLALFIFALMVGLFSIFSNLLIQSLYQGVRETLTEK